MKNLLWSEYTERLSEVAAKWGADEGAAVSRNNEVTWTCPLESLTVRLGLQNKAATKHGTMMFPELNVGRASAPMGPAHIARARMASGVETLDKGLAALSEVAHFHVWFGKAPCDFCSGRGHTGNTPCRHCNGTGLRSEPEPETKEASDA